MLLLIKPLRRLFLTILVAFSLLMTGIFLPIDAENGRDGSEWIPARAGGPEVNKSAVYWEGYEGFTGEVSGEDFFIFTGKGEGDIFDGTFIDWDPDEAFTWTYPPGFNSYNTPLTMAVERWPQSETFSYAAIICENPDFNTEDYYRDYEREYFVITVTAKNRTGESQAEIRITVHNVNDAPVLPEERNFYGIILSEDTTYEGINKDHDPPEMVMTDMKDPYDNLTYTIEPANNLSRYINVDLPKDGKGVIFIPIPEWACPWIPPTGNRVKGNPSTHAKFFFNCSDEGGLYVRNEFWVYVIPENDPTVIDHMDDVYVDEDSLCEIQLTASDPDVTWPVYNEELDEHSTHEQGQYIVYGTNITEQILDVVLDVNYDEERVEEEGYIAFDTDNSLVGDYHLSCFAHDKQGSGPPQSTFWVYSNFTLHIVNVNDPPSLVVDSPTGTFDYNTSAPIEFDASRTRDDDLIHDQVLNFTWYKDGHVFGYGKLFYKVIEEPGEYNITVNVTDGEFFDETSFNITVLKARVPGEIFHGHDLKRSYMDNTTDALTLYHSTKESRLVMGDDEAIDIVSVSSERTGNSLKITVIFTDELEFVYTDVREEAPSLYIYLVNRTFTEPVDSLTKTYILDFGYPDAKYGRYVRVDFDLRNLNYVKTSRTNIEVQPGFRIRSDGKGVEVTLTFIELDNLGVKPDMEVFAVALMETSVKDSKGLNTNIRSYDGAGYGSTPPDTPIDDVQENGIGDDDSSTLMIIIILAIIILLVVVVAVIILVVAARRKEEPPQYPEQPRVDLLESLTGSDPAQQQESWAPEQPPEVYLPPQ